MQANEARTAAVLEKLQNAIDEKTTGLGEKSEYYNYADMIDRARDTFPEEDVYYKLQTTEDYVTIIVTTKRNKMFALTGMCRFRDQLVMRIQSISLRLPWYRMRCSRTTFYIIIQGYLR